MAPWTPLASAVRYARGILTLREDTWRLPDGSERVYPVLVAGVAVAILAFVDDDRVLLVRQYRHLQRGPSWELPGGGAHPDEAPAAAAQRELREEGGYRAGRIELLTRFHPANAYLDETGYCYVARDLAWDPLPADDDESFERTPVPFAEALRMVLADEITESYSKVAILQYALTARR
jgi:8-oxo-dGTP pyrophosphatase MutT (NUDIX family)